MVNFRILFVAVSFMLLSSGLSFGFGCGDDPPARIEFRDASEGCDPTPDRLTHPIAQGARLDVTVLADGADADVEAAAVEDNGVLALEPADGAIGNPVGVRGLTPGTATLYVRISSGEADYLPLEVAAPTSAIISTDPLTIWNLDTTLTERFPSATDELEEGGYALLPGGVLSLRVELRDASGRLLIGHGAAEWSATPALVTFEQTDPLRDDVSVVAGGEAGEVLITTVAGGSFGLTLAGEVNADSLAVYFPETGLVGSSMALAVGETRTAVLVAFDEAGRVLIGNVDDGFEASLAESEPTVAALVGPPWSTEGGGEIELDEALVAFLQGARVTYVEGLAAGETALSLSALGRTAEVTVTVTE